MLTNRDLLHGFLSTVSYLADDIDWVHVSMGVLHGITGDTIPFWWTYTHQQTFMKSNVLLLGVTITIVHYGTGIPPLNIITDGCGTGIAGVVSQGDNWHTAKVTAFFSMKLNSAQQNYSVHEIEMLAGVETMLWHRDILLDVHFHWYTDHKGLIYILNQKNLSVDRPVG